MQNFESMNQLKLYQRIWIHTKPYIYGNLRLTTIWRCLIYCDIRMFSHLPLVLSILAVKTSVVLTYLFLNKRQLLVILFVLHFSKHIIINVNLNCIQARYMSYLMYNYLQTQYKKFQ